MPSLHERAKDVFLSALERPARERPAYIATACGDDTDLRAEVESLLVFHGDTSVEAAISALEAPTPTTGDHPASPEDEPFKPGALFAGRYRMITRLGRGGMSDVWRADDLVLDTPVALKLIHAPGAQGRQQIINEVRLARQITHPAVCRVYDVGESDGQVFLSMELIDGEDLATLLRRVGRLPSEKVVDIARQLCAGLAAAHARGVLHRDLKPANVMIDDDGQVRITDFGIAVPRGDDAPPPIGTPGYMAPEQLVRGGRLSEGTDLYSLGLILYELACGQHPFRNGPRTGAALVKPSARIAGIDPQLERVILQALETEPAARPPSAAAMLAAMPAAASIVERKPIAWGWVMTGAVAVALVLAAVAWALLTTIKPSNGLTQQDTIVLADFSNLTGEPVFDGALKVALAVALEQSPFLKVFPDARMRETLRLMGRSAAGASGGIDRSVAREIAQREQLKALIAGSIAPLGNHFVLTLEAVNAESGDVMAREQAEAATREEVLVALGTAASRLREKLGESLASVQRFDAPLARATTSSLEALHAYSQALDGNTINPRLEGIPHLKRALELDPDFALAHARLGTVLSNRDAVDESIQHQRRAYELRDRVSEYERLYITSHYYGNVTDEVPKYIEVLRAWQRTYPNDFTAANNLAVIHLQLGDYPAARDAAREALRLAPRHLLPRLNLSWALLFNGEIDAAATTAREAIDANLATDFTREVPAWAAYFRNDAAGLAREIADQGELGRRGVRTFWRFRPWHLLRHGHAREALRMWTALADRDRQAAERDDVDGQPRDPEQGDGDQDHRGGRHRRVGVLADAVPHPPRQREEIKQCHQRNHQIDECNHRQQPRVGQLAHGVQNCPLLLARPFR
mgnify:CR=1 FL=1